jgi:hypothetical protein
MVISRRLLVLYLLIGFWFSGADVPVQSLSCNRHGPL